MDYLLWVMFVAPGIYQRFVSKVNDLRIGKTENAVQCIRNYRKESCMARSESFLHVSMREFRAFPKIMNSFPDHNRHGVACKMGNTNRVRKAM